MSKIVTYSMDEMTLRMMDYIIEKFPGKMTKSGLLQDLIAKEFRRLKQEEDSSELPAR